MNEQTARYLVGQATNEKEGTWGGSHVGKAQILKKGGRT